MKTINVTDTVQYIGVDDKTIDLFESQYVVPNGVSYNSYVILDEKTAVMDSVDARGTKEEPRWRIFSGRGPFLRFSLDLSCVLYYDRIPSEKASAPDRGADMARHQFLG